MKKFFYATLVALAGLAVASCDLLNPDEGGEQTGETKAPVLSEIQGAVLDAKGADITTTYTAADFGQRVTINYALFVDKAGNKMAKKSEVKASIADGKITIKQSELSLAIMALGVEVGEEVEVELALYAYVGSTITSAALVSNYVKATFTTCAATIDDDTLAKIEVVGDFDGWGSEGAANMGAYLYKYGEDEVYSGLVGSSVSLLQKAVGTITPTGVLTRTNSQRLPLRQMSSMLLTSLIPRLPNLPLLALDLPRT